MTEEEWLASEGLLVMIDCLRATKRVGRLSERVRRLFAVACSRRVWSYLVSDRSRAAVELSEFAADHLFAERDLAIACGKADDAVYDLNDLPEKDPRIWAGYTASHGARPHLDIDHILEVGFYSGGIGDGGTTAIAALLREVVGNPFHPSPPLSPAVFTWNEGTVRRIAEGIYAERAFGRMPILHDTLLDAGYTDEALLSHCRNPEGHVRGCWTLDLVLGKE